MAVFEYKIRTILPDEAKQTAVPGREEGARRKCEGKAGQHTMNDAVILENGLHAETCFLSDDTTSVQKNCLLGKEVVHRSRQLERQQAGKGKRRSATTSRTETSRVGRYEIEYLGNYRFALYAIGAS